jgi:glutamate-1-semialdehyde 2,1-aminomutase
VTIRATYERLHPRSATLHKQALGIFPDGVTHDTRRFTPFPLYVERAQGPRKWDVDGNELIDYVSGHGALLLGHGRREVVEAVQRQAALGTHLGASHEHEIAWGRWVQQLIPSAERVRFTSSGTEAVHMAVRLARAFTQRDLVVRFAGNFHGWSDTVSSVMGVPQAARGLQLILPQNDAAAFERALADHGDAIAAVIIEPTGASMGGLPVDPAFLHLLRDRTARAGIVLIFDEVVTGFRISPGGAQAYYGITPDLTTLAKILAGGLPGGAVAGREDLLAMINFTDPSGAPRTARVPHPGTFNANPLSAAAGAAALAIVATGEPHRAADAAARRLATEMNAVIRRHEVPGCVYGQSSLLHILLGQEAPVPADGITWEWPDGERTTVPHTAPPLVTAFRQAMINEGVDPMGVRLIVSAAHDDAAVEHTIAAFDRALAALQEEGLL